MATATITKHSTGSHVDPKVTHPLDRLRGTIQKYVVIEGLLSAAIFIAAWFALGVAFDFGLFKLTTWDWVLDAPAWLRVAALVIAVLLLTGIVIFRIAIRLTKELSYPALALVLERKFPKVLGDRLITAVELADVEKQSRYGYSSAMIRLTIDEARERVGTVPVNEVFNWKRLRRMATVAVALVLGVVVAGYAAFAAGTKSADPYRFGWRFAHVSGAFLERNVLIRNVPWPRRAHIELVAFPGDDLRIGKDAADPVIHAKAFRWVIADRSTTMGWRPLAWGDLSESLLGGPVPTLPKQAFLTVADGSGDDPSQWTLDRVQAVAIEDKETRDKLNAAMSGSAYVDMQNDLERVFAKLNDLAGNPSMGRTLRKLDVPEKVALAYTGQSKTGEVTLGPQKNNEFSSPITDLKESVHFVVSAEDFRTPSKTITLVPPPMFTTLTETEYQPAYLHHTPPDFNYAALRGLPPQKMVEKGLTLTGDRTRISVSSGTELVITAKTDTDLTAAYLLPKVGVLPGARPGSADPVPLTIGADKRTVNIEFRGDYRLANGLTFKHKFTDANGKPAVATVTTQPTIEFDLMVEQADHVTAKRQISLQIADDQPPIVEIAPDVIRKVGNVYYVTPKAKIPFNPESYIRDDHGLSKVAYEYTYWSEDSDIGRALRVQLLARPFMYAVGPANAPSTVATAYQTVKFRDLDKGDQRQNGSAQLARFLDDRAKLQFETIDTLKRKLAEPREESAANMITKIELKSPEVDFFDVKQLKLLASVSEVQTRYRLDLNIIATDTNFDTGPKTGQNSEPIRLLVVSEGELLAEINKEEEAFALRLDEALVKFAAARKRWEVVRLFFGQVERIEDSRVKATDVSQDVGKARDVVATLVREYRRIHRECIVNDVRDVTRDHYGKFANRIERVLGETPPLIPGEVATTPSMTFPETERRLELVQNSLNVNMWGDLTNVTQTEAALLLLEKELRQIRAELGEQQSKEKLKIQLQAIVTEQERIGAELRAAKLRWEESQFKKEPEFGTIGPAFLTKGETKKIKHSINWRQYDKDEIILKTSVVDKDKKPVPAEVLGVPATLKLEFGENPTSFEYEVKAGVKEGEYTITITPAVGEPLTVIVTVK